MTKPLLKLARAPKTAKRPSLSMVKQAIRLYRGRGVPREVYRKNALRWVAARMAMGERHILNQKFEPRWGEPGLPTKVAQVFAPRRLGGK